jgi:GT2 family glycosyltransferase
MELADDYWAALRHQDCSVIVVDNASDPPLPNAWRLDRNSGFSHASNVGLELARTDAVLFLNNDIAMRYPDWLQRIREALEPGVLVGPALRHDLHAWVDGEPYPYLDGWCLAGMRQDLLELGGFDESFEEPSYYSDNELCFRARIAGMSLREVRSGLWHKGGRTTSTEAAGTWQVVTDRNKARFASLVRDSLGVAA